MKQKRPERLTVALFAVDFALRLWTAKYLYPDLKEYRAVLKYMFSFSGFVDQYSRIKRMCS